MSGLTLVDIAKKAGVSRSTVSRVINDQPNVRSEVRKRVWRVIEETGYQPNPAARSLASQRTGIIGLVIPRSVQSLFTDPFFPRITQGITQACNQHDYTLSLFLLHTEEEEKKLYPRITRPGLMDGVIVQVGHMDDDLIPRLAETMGTPFVVAGRPVSAPSTSYVDVDNVTGSCNAVLHLVRSGYTRIGTITGPLTTATGVDRLEGYRNALNQRGLTINDLLIAEGDFTDASGYFAAKRLLQHNPEALYVASDMMAIGALRAIRECGLSVPEDIAVIGFDDIPAAAISDPPLTTVRQPVRRIGMQLVESLLDIIENGNEPPRCVVFDTKLVIRASCG
jgi:LacI family transcriptional regulator